MLFEKVTQQNILEGIEDFNSKGIPNGYGPSTTYDLMYEGIAYPPKAIMVYANFRASGRKIEPYFKGGLGTDCFKTYEKLGFFIIKKPSSDQVSEIFQIQVSKNQKDSNGEFLKAKMQISKEGYELLTGSYIYKEPKPSFLEHPYYKMRVKFEKDGYFEESNFNDYVILKKSITFKKPSPAAVIALNRAANGKNEWKLQDGTTLEEYQKKYDMKNQKLYELKKRFLSEWTIERLQNMSLNEYTNLEKTSFCYWLEHITRDIGSIVGGSSYKFGIYERSGNSEVKEESNRTTDGEYAWFKKYGPSRNEAFESIRKILIQIANSAKNNELSNIENIDLGFAYKWKIAFLYGDYNVVNIFKEKTIRRIANEFEIEESQLPLYPLHSKILNKKLKEEDYFDFTRKYWKLLNDNPFSDAKLQFKKYLINIHKLKNKSTAKAYVTNLDKVETWFKEHELVSDSYNIWDVNNDNYSIHNILNSSFKQKWYELNQQKNGWYGTPWNRWLEFIDWSTKEDDKEEGLELKNRNTDPINVILYGPPGTGKTYSLKKEYFSKYLTKETKRYKFVTFHQSFSYEDFIEGIKPILPEGDEVSGDLGYKIEDGVFKELCIDAKNDPENKYAIFIDEINRGNVSAIFGELITLIETDKRTGMNNELSVVLPYSKKVFSVPQNIDIYGTMNTADRSVEALDTALRRRFSFVEMMPRYDVIENKEIEKINLGNLLKIINDRIEILIDRDHTIGHSYFVDIDTSEKLTTAFNDKIIPLLQEYFYGDYGKIGLVLGKGFVNKVKTKTIKFAKFDYDDSDDFKVPKYDLTKVTSKNIIEAIKILLREDKDPNGN